MRDFEIDHFQIWAECRSGKHYVNGREYRFDTEQEAQDWLDNHDGTCPMHHVQWKTAKPSALGKPRYVSFSSIIAGE